MKGSSTPKTATDTRGLTLPKKYFSVQYKDVITEMVSVGGTTYNDICGDNIRRSLSLREGLRPDASFSKKIVYGLLLILH
jgi:hypothetical protein